MDILALLKTKNLISLFDDYLITIIHLRSIYPCLEQLRKITNPERTCLNNRITKLEFKRKQLHSKLLKELGCDCPEERTSCMKCKTCLLLALYNILEEVTQFKEAA